MANQTDTTNTQTSSSTWKALVRKKKIALGRPVSPTPSELARDNEQDLDADATILQSAGRIITLHPGNILKKTGRRVFLGEADAMRVAAAGGVPVPHIYGSETTPAGLRRLTMSYVAGETLAAVWHGLSAAEKRAYARQLRDILTTMRAIAPPPDGYIGACDGAGMRDGRPYDTFTAPACHGETEFNRYLMSCLHSKTPPLVRDAFARRLAQQPAHRIVLTHGDLAPRNILVRDGAIVALIDWEDSGWLPEYWEYVKLFQRMAAMERDWPDYAADMFPQQYPDELVDYLAMSQWQPLWAKDAVGRLC
ncbi:MAG: hypothetical protein STHCBS139747_006872 [Sporothrix thermara]